MDATQDPGRFAGNFASNIASGFVPMESALRTLNDSLDPAIRNPQNMWERIQAGLPVVSESIQARLDALGCPAEKAGSRGAAALVSGGVAPAKAKSDIDAELARLGPMGLKPIGFAGKALTVDKYRIELTQEERNDYQDLRGRYLQAYPGKLFKSDEYQSMDDHDKVDEADSAIRDAERDAREEMITQALDTRRKQFAAKSGVPRTPGLSRLAPAPAN